jgi:Ca-activated chloride channel homolog
MTRSRMRFSVIIAVALAGAISIVAFNQPQIHNAIPAMPVAAVAKIEPLQVQVATSITKQKWLKEAAKAFAAKGETSTSGRPIAIDVTGVLSGDSMLAIAEGRLSPAAWSPGEQNWVSELNERWKAKYNQTAIRSSCKPTTLTPLGIAIWRPMAEALGWPNKKISWKTLIDLAGDPQGWSRLGHPEWGRLKLGFSHPQYSSAGLLFLSTAIHAVLGKPRALEAKDIYRPEVEEALVKLNRNTAKYGLSSAELLNMMAKHGPQFLHAVSAFEQATVQLNIEHGQELRWPLVFIFPEEGTFWSDHPYCVLDGLEGTSAEAADAARRFGEFLLEPAQQAITITNYVRPIDAKAAIGAPLTIANGTDPSVSIADVPPLPVPGPAESKAIIDSFLTTKRKATVELVLDTSGSMDGEAIRSATEATRQFIVRLAPKDRVGLLAFNGDITEVSSLGDVSRVGEQLSRQVVNLVAGGGTDLNGAICEGVDKLKKAQERDAATGENRLYGLVLLSDGADNAGAVSEGRMFQECLPSGAEAGGIKVFTIAFGKEARTDLLQRIAQVSGGASFAADSRSIEQAYLKISAEQ